ncbi:MAG: cytoskeletal protein CcmA (bactofilin family) [Paraglaciecola sp.]|jgi:cytoskeletal protein CcmA (bactofilin family)
MFSKNKNTQPPTTVNKNGTPSIIGGDVVIQGNITGQGVVQLDGKFEGEIHIHSLTVGEQGWVDGLIDAQEVMVKGKVTGAINAIKVTLDKTADVNGDITHHSISIASGAKVQGSIKQINEEQKITDLNGKKTAKKTA